MRRCTRAKERDDQSPQRGRKARHPDAKKQRRGREPLCGASITSRSSQGFACPETRLGIVGAQRSATAPRQSPSCPSRKDRGAPAATPLRTTSLASAEESRRLAARIPGAGASARSKTPASRRCRATAGLAARSRASARVTVQTMLTLTSNIMPIPSSFLRCLVDELLHRRRPVSSSNSPGRRSSSVASALSVELPKKAAARGGARAPGGFSWHRRRIIVARTVLLDDEMSLGHQRAQRRSHGGVGRRVIHRFAHLGGGVAWPRA